MALAQAKQGKRHCGIFEKIKRALKIIFQTNRPLDGPRQPPKESRALGRYKLPVNKHRNKPKTLNFNQIVFYQQDNLNYLDSSIFYSQCRYYVKLHTFFRMISWKQRFY